jgi:hypothetical protein
MDKLSERLTTLESRVDQLVLKHEAHGIELADLRRGLTQMQVQLGRILDSQTTHGLTLDRVELTMQKLLIHLRGPLHE